MIWKVRGIVQNPPSSPDLTPVSFFVRGFSKDKVYGRKPETIAKMSITIEKECTQTSEEMLLDVSRYISSKYKKRIEQNGNQFEHLCEHSEIAP